MSSLNSQLRPIGSTTAVISGYSDPEPLKVGPVFSLYRVKRDGKYFIVKTATDGSGNILALIRREYELSIALNHPNIVNVFVFEDHTPVGPGIVMEYIDGRTLGEFLSENPSRHQRRRILDQLLDAVAYIHLKGIIHNDLKSENILISRVDNTLKIIDFGLSEHDAYFLSRGLGCTPEYASPELLNQQHIDNRSDIYSLGLLVRDILDGHKRRVWTKAANPKKHRRYSDIDQMRRDLDAGKRVRSILFPIFLIFVVVLAFVIPRYGLRHTLIYDHDSVDIRGLIQKNDSLEQSLNTLEKEQIHNATKRREVDSICVDLSSRIAGLFEPLIETIPKMSSSVQAYSELLSVLEQSSDLELEYCNKVQDFEGRSIVSSTFSSTQLHYLELCTQLIAESLKDTSELDE